MANNTDLHRNDMFKQYKRSNLAEMRPVTIADISDFRKIGMILVVNTIGEYKHPIRVSISDEDLKNGSPVIGDMIARNPNNHNDQWLVAEQYFKENFEARIQEQGEAFPMDEVKGLLRDHTAGGYGAKAIHKYLSTRAAEWAARKVAELQAWKESAMKILNDINLQEVGRVLDIPLGKSVSELILPSIVLLKLKSEGMYTEEQIRSALAGVCLSIQTQEFIIRTLKRIINQIKQSK